MLNADCSFSSPSLSITIEDYLLGFHGTEGVGSNRPAHVSLAGGRFAGHPIHARGGQGARRGTGGQEVQTTVWRGAGAADLRSSALRRPRAAGVGAVRFVRSTGIADGDGSQLCA